MSAMVQIRNVPDDIHRAIKVRAAMAGMSMSDFLLREIERIAARPTREELLARIAELPPVETPMGAAEVLREARGDR